jgi:hypothetical protein
MAEKVWDGGSKRVKRKLPRFERLQASCVGKLNMTNEITTFGPLGASSLNSLPLLRSVFLQVCLDVAQFTLVRFLESK